METVIPADETFLLLAILCFSSAMAFWVDSSERLGVVPGIIVAFFVPMALSSFGVIPEAAPIYATVDDYFIALAIPLFLFRADLREIVDVGRPLLLAFGIATLGTIVGVLLGFVLLDLGPDGASLAGVMAATYIGGSINFVAVANTVSFSEPSSIAVAYAADAIGGTLFIVLFALLPGLALMNKFLPAETGNALIGEKDAAADSWGNGSGIPINLFHILMVFSISSLICFLSKWLTVYLGYEQYFVVCVSLIAIVIANIFRAPIKKLTGGFELGMALVYVAFGVIGAATNISHLSATASIHIVLFAITIVVVHLIVVLLGARLFKISLAESLVASNAAILGSVMAAVMAASMKWRRLAMPGLMCGILGIAIANFVGIALAELLSNRP